MEYKLSSYLLNKCFGEGFENIISNLDYSCNSWEDQAVKGRVEAINKERSLKALRKINVIQDNLQELSSGKFLISEELKEVLFDYTPSELVNSVSLYNQLRLCLPVVGLNDTNEIVIKQTYDFDTSTYERVLIENIPEGLLLGGKLEMINKLVNSKVNEKVENKVVEALNTTNLTVSKTGNLESYLSLAVSKLSKHNKQNITIVLSLEEYLINVAQLKNIEKINIVIAPVSNIFIGNLKALALNFKILALDLDKDIKKGLLIGGMNINSFKAAILDENAIVKIVE